MIDLRRGNIDAESIGSRERRIQGRYTHTHTHTRGTARRKLSRCRKRLMPFFRAPGNTEQRYSFEDSPTIARVIRMNGGRVLFLGMTWILAKIASKIERRGWTWHARIRLSLRDEPDIESLKISKAGRCNRSYEYETRPTKLRKNNGRNEWRIANLCSAVCCSRVFVVRRRANYKYRQLLPFCHGVTEIEKSRKNTRARNDEEQKRKNLPLGLSPERRDDSVTRISLGFVRYLLWSFVNSEISARNAKHRRCSPSYFAAWFPFTVSRTASPWIRAIKNRTRLFVQFQFKCINYDQIVDLSKSFSDAAARKGQGGGGRRRRRRKERNFDTSVSLSPNLSTDFYR